MNVALQRQAFDYWTTDKPLRLRRCMAKSAEGAIWKTDLPGILAKIYHEPSRERADKLAQMIANPPHDPTLKDGYVAITWPKDIIYDAQGLCCGFTMAEVGDALPINVVYNPKLRRHKAPKFNWYYLHVTALNIAWILQSLHKKGYVVGDLKSEHFLVNQRAHVSVIDTDSFQIPGNGAQPFRCLMGSEGFTPPELIGTDLKLVDRTVEHDRFGLAVLIHLLLLGYHPYSGAWEGEGELPPRDQLVRLGYWVGLENTKHSLRMSPLSIPYTAVHPSLYEAFKLAFDRGHENPSLRPSAADWITILENALDNLIICDKEDGHFYGDHLESCLWCQRREDMNLDVFPTPKGFMLSPFLVLKRFERAFKKNDLRAQLKLWDEHPIIRSHTPFAFFRDKQDGIRRQLKQLDEFIDACIKGKQDDLTLWEYWHTSGIKDIRGIERETIEGVPIEAYMETIHVRIKAFEELEEALSQAYREEKVGALKESTEKKIAALLSKYEDILKSTETLKKYGLTRRVNEARLRLKQWEKLAQALAGNDDGQILSLWYASPLLRDFGPVKAHKDRIDQAQHRKSALDCFLNVALNDPQNDQELVRLWDADPTLDQSTLAERRYEVLGNRSGREFITQARKRLGVFHKIQDLSAQTPLNFLEIADTWDTKLCTGYPVFDQYKSLVHLTYDKSQQYRDLLVALQGDDAAAVRRLWDERNFAQLAAEHKLEDKIRQAFAQAILGDFELSTFHPLEQVADRIHVGWRWTSQAPLAVVSARADRFSLNPDDVEQVDHTTVLWRGLFERQGGASLPFTPKMVYVSIWPCFLVCGRPVPLGRPLQITNMADRRVSYRIRLVQKFKTFKKTPEKTLLKVTIESKQNLSLPETVLLFKEGTPPIPGDKKALELSKLPAVDIHAHAPMTVEFDIAHLPKSIHGAHFNLFPIDFSQLDVLEFQHLDPTPLHLAP